MDSFMFYKCHNLVIKWYSMAYKYSKQSILDFFPDLRIKCS